jgi:hypothetical protein
MFYAYGPRWFSLNEAPLGLFKFISDYLPYFEKNKYIFQYHSKKSLNLFIRIDRNYLFGSFEITSIRLYTPLRNSVCTTWLRLFLHELNKNCDQSLIDITEILLKAALSTINPPSYCVNQSLRKCILTNVVIKHFLFCLYYIEFKHVVHVEVPTYLCILFKWLRSYHIIHQIINV